MQIEISKEGVVYLKSLLELDNLTLPTTKVGGFSVHRRSHLLLPEGSARA